MQQVGEWSDYQEWKGETILLDPSIADKGAVGPHKRKGGLFWTTFRQVQNETQNDVKNTTFLATFRLVQKWAQNHGKTLFFDPF